MMPDLLSELRRIDPLAGDAVPPAASGFEELRVAIVRTPRPVPNRGARWAGAAIAVAAVVIAAVILWPGPRAGAPVPAVPAGTPTTAIPVDTWVQTATSPLSPRRGSFTVWADGTFFVIGGDASPACPPAAVCTKAEQPLRDGARYNPVTDSWRRIADAPVELVTSLANPNQPVAVLGRALYVASGETVLSYDLDADRWAVLPQPPAPVLSVLSVDGMLVAVTAPTTGSAKTGYLRYASNRQLWVEYALEGEVPGPIEGATAVDGYLVLTGSSTEGSTTKQASWVARIPSFAGPAQTAHVPALDDQRRTPVPLQTRSGGYAVWPRDPEKAYFYQPATDAWSSVEQPATPGPLSGTVQGEVRRSWYVTVAGMIALNGRLYDPVSRLWSSIPDLPTGTDEPVVAAGDTSILACFGFTGAEVGRSCHLLSPAPASEATPR